MNISLTATDHNGYHISCFGGRDGAIDAAITGGTAPYSISWSNSATTEDIANLASGLYIITVTDANLDEATAEITLTEPVQLKVTTQPFLYPSGYNVSCHDCFNGSIDVSVSHGVPPYTYAWEDGPATQDRSGLGALSYRLLVTDDNGCELLTEKLQLTQPERDDWRMEGNAGTDPATQYIGTSDAQDVVLKSNGAERVRLLSDGSIKLTGADLPRGPLYLDADGILKAGGFEDGPPPLSEPCIHLHSYPYWKSSGNSFPLGNICEGEEPVLGTKNAHPLRVITNDLERMIVTATGKVGIGTTPPAGPVDGYRLFVNDGIATRDVLVKLGAWPDYVFSDSYRLMPMSELRTFVKRHSHLPTIPSAAELDAQGGIALADISRKLTRTVEEQALYILQLEDRATNAEERMRVMEQRLNALEASK